MALNDLSLGELDGDDAAEAEQPASRKRDRAAAKQQQDEEQQVSSDDEDDEKKQRRRLLEKLCYHMKDRAAIKEQDSILLELRKEHATDYAEKNAPLVLQGATYACAARIESKLRTLDQKVTAVQTDLGEIKTLLSNVVKMTTKPELNSDEKVLLNKHTHLIFYSPFVTRYARETRQIREITMKLLMDNNKKKLRSMVGPDRVSVFSSDAGMKELRKIIAAKINNLRSKARSELYSSTGANLGGGKTGKELELPVLASKPFKSYGTEITQAKLERLALLRFYAVDEDEGAAKIVNDKCVWFDDWWKTVDDAIAGLWKLDEATRAKKLTMVLTNDLKKYGGKDAYDALVTAAETEQEKDAGRAAAAYRSDPRAGQQSDDDDDDDDEGDGAEGSALGGR